VTVKLFVLFFDVIKSCRGNEAKGTIFGALGNVTEAIKSKLTMPSDIVEETRAAREHGGTGRTVVEVKVEDSKPGKVATSLKASDQMTGQTFNDVGRMDDDARKDKGKL